MRTSLTLITMCLFTSIAGAGERDAVVIADQAVLLAGPGAGMPEAAVLRRGTRLRIVREEGDYYAVQPPAGSIAWIRHVYLTFVPEKPGGPTQFPTAAVVDSNNQARLRIGRVGEPRPLNVERTAVPDGTLLTVIGQKVEIEGVKWYPVIAPEDDVRYVARNAVQIGGEIESKFVVRSPQSGPVGDPLKTLPTSSPSASSWNHPLWIEAQRLDRAGDWDKAEKTYLELAREMNKPGGNEKLAEECYARVHDLRDKRRRSTGSRVSRDPVPVTPTRNDVVPASASSREPVATGTPARTETDAKPRWIGPGTLYGSALRTNGQQKMFALQSTSDTVIAYAIGGTGIDLGKLTGQRVRLYGTVTPMTGFPGKEFMVVSQVEQEP